MNIGDSISICGCITQRKYLTGRTLTELEEILGFDKKRFSMGVFIAALKRMPNQGEYLLSGYTQVSTNNRDKQYGKDLQSRYDMKVVTRNLQLETWALSGPNQLVKVYPMLRQGNYPPGKGVPQWEVLKSCPIDGVVIAVINDYPSGRFIL